MTWTAEQEADLRAIAEGREKRNSTATDPAEELTTLLALQTVGLRVVSAALFGRGSNAVAHINLTDDKRITLDPLGKFTSPSKLTVEVALQVGAAPVLKTPDVVRTMVALHKLAEHFEVLTEDNRAADWGISYLQTAQAITVRMSDQRDRWGAFDKPTPTRCQAPARTASPSRRRASS